MQTEPDTLTNLKRLGQILETLAGELASLFRNDSAQVRYWRRSLEAMAASLQEQTLRIAVVGSVKAGKSTFINALHGRDLLKRGAGIITAFITRIRSGSEECGWVEIKSWAEINAELNEALAVVGLPSAREGPGQLDIRREADRRALDGILQEVRGNHPAEHDTFDPNVVLINAYLEGFKTLGAHVSDRPVRLEFTRADLHRHQDLVGQESQAVYLRDIELQVPIPWLGEAVEIGDCQGSDSPNPLHFALLQDYLLSSHGILYLISSRIGVRQADVKLIEAIKILRLLPQTLFILNADLDDHGSVADLERLRERVEEDLRLLAPEAKVYTFSALFHLLESGNGQRPISPREARRLEGWYAEKELVQASRSGYKEFQTDFQHLIKRERSRLLYGGVLGHLQRVTQSMRDSVSARQGLLARDVAELEELAEELRSGQEAVTGVITTARHTLEGLRDSLKAAVRSAVDSFFDNQKGRVVDEILTMIEQHPVDSFDRSKMAESRQVAEQLHLFYQDFRKALSRHLVDRVNLRVIDFAKTREEEIEQQLVEAVKAYWDLLGHALRQYQKSLTAYGVPIVLETPESLPLPRRPALKPPPFSAFLQQSEAMGRGSLLVRFGLGRLRQFFAGLKDRVFRRGPKDEAETSEQLFQEAVALVKQETQNELLAYFLNYRENFKFAFLFVFVDRYAEALVQVFRDFGEATMLDIGQIQEAAERRGLTQRDETEDLAILRQRLQYAEEQLHGLGQSLGWSPSFLLSTHGSHDPDRTS
jgi:GTPase SAR1 family protein